MYIYAGLTTIASVVVTCKLFYKYIRPKFPVKVNCWFCQKNHEVPYGNANCWDCPYCDQYNGFTSDGDYNKLIPSQHDNLLNTGGNIDATQVKNDGAENGLCDQCNRDQLLKVKQLAAFVPCNDIAFDAEIEDFQNHLESVYKLCHRCEEVLYRKLAAQNESLRSKVLSWKLEQKPKNQSSGKRNSVFSARAMCIKFLQSLSLGISLALISQSVILLSASGEIEFASLRKILRDDLASSIGQLRRHTYVIVGLFSLIFSVLMAGKERLRVIDAIGCFSWLAGLFTTLPIPTLELISERDRLIGHGLLSVVCLLTTLFCMVWRNYPQGCSGARWKSMSPNYACSQSRNMSGSSGYSTDQGLVRSEPSPAQSDVFRRSLLQDSCITTTSTAKSCPGRPETISPKKDFDLYTDLQAMKIGTPQKCPSLSNIFATKSYDSTSRFPPPSSPCGVARNILNTACLKTKSLTKSSWVAGGYWATTPSGPYGSHSSESHLDRRSKWTFTGMPPGSKHLNRFYGSLNTSFSCPVSREGSTSGDDRLSVFSEPSHRSFRPPQITLTPSSLATFRDSVSPRRDGSLANGGEDDDGSDSRNSGASERSGELRNSSPGEEAVAAAVMNDGGRFGFARKGATAWNMLLFPVLSISLIANSILLGYFVHQYTGTERWNS